MTKTSGKKLNLLKSLEILQSNSFISFYHFNNLSKREWDEIKLKLKEIERVALKANGLLGVYCQADTGRLAPTTQAVREGGHRPLGLCQASGADNQLAQAVPCIPTNPPLQPTTTKATPSHPRVPTTSLCESLASPNVGVSRDSYLPEKGSPVEKRELFEIKALVLKSKAIVKVLAPLLSGTNNRKEGGKVSSLALCKPNNRNLGCDKQPVGFLPCVPCHGHANHANHANHATRAQEQETAFKERSTSLEKALSLVEGPTLLVGASTVEGFKESAKYLEKEKGLVFVGGVLENQFVNHLDLKECLKRDLLGPAHLVQALRLSLIITPLAYYSNKLLFLLQKRQESLKDC